MSRYLIRKALSGMLVLLGVIVVLFLLFLFINVDPTKMTLGQRSDLASEQAVRERLGLDKPWYGRLGLYLGNLSPVWVHSADAETKEELRYAPLFNVGGDKVVAAKWPYLGRSFQTNRRVSSVLFHSLGNTLILALAALIVALGIGLILGIIAAVKAHTWIDQLVVSVSAVGVSIPSYFSAIVLSFVLGYLWQEVTGLNMIGSLRNLEGNIEWKNLILPAIALGIRPVAIITQLTRSSMLDVLSSDYIRTARAKGLSGRIVLFRHALRNALNPVVTSVSGWLASLLAGAYFVEVIFNFKGLGFVTIQAIETYDFPVLMGAVLVGASIFVLINILVDIAYGMLDPRIKLS